MTDFAAQIERMDEALRPIANRPVDITDGDWVATLRALPDPLDEAGISDDVARLLEQLIDRYEQGTDDDRHEIRRVVREHRAFLWAAHFPRGPMDAQVLRRDLVLFSIKDMGADPRDAIVELEDICMRARKVGLDPSDALGDVAALSSDDDHFGFGSTRRIVLSQRDRNSATGRGGRDG